MVVREGKTVLPNPMPPRDADSPGSISIGRLVWKAIDIHNGSLHESQKKDHHLDKGTQSPRQFSFAVYKTIEQVFSTDTRVNRFFAKRSYRYIKAHTSPADFNASMRSMEAALEQSHDILSKTDDHWGARKAIVQKMQNLKAHAKQKKRKQKGMKVKSRDEMPIGKSSRRQERDNRKQQRNGKGRVNITESIDPHQSSMVAKEGTGAHAGTDTARNEDIEKAIRRARKMNRKAEKRNRKAQKKQARENAGMVSETETESPSDVPLVVAAVKAVKRKMKSQERAGDDESQKKAKLQVKAASRIFCSISDCRGLGPPTHICLKCDALVHNICTQRLLGSDFEEDLFYCSVMCKRAYFE